MKTGDIILFEKGSFFSSIWKKPTKMIHVCMIIKDPDFLHPDLKGVYIMESNLQGINAESVTNIYPLAEIASTTQQCNVYCRSLTSDTNTFPTDKLKEIYETVKHKPYDICSMEWIEDCMNNTREDYIWGSALIGYIYSTCGIIHKDQDWTKLTPNDFSSQQNSLNFINDYKFEDQMQLK